MRKHFVLLGILGLGVGILACGQQKTTTRVDKIGEQHPAAMTSARGTKAIYYSAETGELTSTTPHPMGPSCSGLDDSVCHLTVSSIRADEKNPSHSAVNLSTDKQDSLHISGEKPFTVEFVSDDKGPAPFYRPTGKPSKVFASGPAREEASGHKYHMVIHDQEGSVDPHICIGGGGSSC